MGITNTSNILMNNIVHKSLINSRVDNIIKLKFDNINVYIPAALYQGYTLDDNGMLMFNGIDFNDFVKIDKYIVAYHNHYNNANDNDEYEYI